MTAESKLIPVLRDGVNVIKMIVFMELKNQLATHHPDWGAERSRLMAGAILNELFGTPNDQPPYAGFVAGNETAIRSEMALLSSYFDHLRIPLTDALRIQFLCDDLEGIGNASILARAKALGILLVDRSIPLPKTFMQLVRKLGVAYKILSPETVPETGEEDDHH